MKWKKNCIQIWNAEKIVHFYELDHISAPFQFLFLFQSPHFEIFESEM